MNMLPQALYGDRSWEDALKSTLATPSPKLLSSGWIGDKQFFVAAIVGTPALWAQARESVREGDIVEVIEKGSVALQKMFATKVQYVFSEQLIGGICFLLLVSLTLESVLKGFSHYVQSVLPGGIVIAMTVYLIFDFAVVVLLFAIIFKFLPDVKIQWRDIWIGAVMTALFFGIGKWALGLYLGTGAAGSAYGAASSLITLLLWVYYSSQILLFGAEFTQVYADRAGRELQPDEHAIRVEIQEIKGH